MYCRNSTTSTLTAIGTGLLWYTGPTGGSSIPAPTPSTGTAGTVSYYVSQNLCGEGPRSQIDVVVNALPVITVNSATICTGSSVMLTASGATAYSWSNSSTTAAITVTPTGGMTSYTVTGTASGCSAKAVTIVSDTVCIGIEENSNIQDISVYPNPSNGDFTISVSNANFTNLSVTVINILGEVVYSNTFKNNSVNFNKQIDLNQLSNGVYYFRLSTGTDTKIKKLIIQ